LKAFFPEIDTSLWPSSLFYSSRKGETVAEVHARADAFLEAFVPTVMKAGNIDGRRPLLVTHAATAITLVRSLTGQRKLPLKVGCCTLSELHLQGGEMFGGGSVVGAFVATKLADGSHLKEGASRQWGFDDIEVEDGRVVEDPGEPGTENEEDFPLGLQSQLLSKF